MTDGRRAWPGADLFERHPLNPILTVKDLGYPANAVFNAAAAQVDGETVLLARVEDKRGLTPPHGLLERRRRVGLARG